MTNNTKALKGLKAFEAAFPPRFPGMAPLPEGFRNGVRGWTIHDVDRPGLRTMDIEHVPDDLVAIHNDPARAESLMSMYNTRLCLHRCPGCFNKQSGLYTKKNHILDMEETFAVVDAAAEVAKKTGHRLECTKFLGPGELLISPQVFEIIEEYAKRGIHFSIFTKGAMLGDDALAAKHFGGMGITSAKALVDKLASYANVTILMSFQSFDPLTADALVTSTVGGRLIGLTDYSRIRDMALANLLQSAFMKEDGTTDRICMLNAPIVPENIHESFDIYRVFMERGIPVVMTPTMVSGLGKDQLCGQAAVMEPKEFQRLVEELYSDIYAYNVAKGIQTLAQIEREGIASYVGAEPCNQVAHGVYLRANGVVQMCPGRFDDETTYGNALRESLEALWAKSPHESMNLVNNRCPAKDSTCPEQDAERTFHFGFYDRVMALLKKKLGLPDEAE
ncbi:MAG: hypothetical protein V1827_05140 [Candidatus Micrarchaeota archaeon]